ncbi:PadR family transcriptional regulator PadR [Bacillus thermophilus]|uniref:PadR family transcriptional regulator PadR n=1 Tax=Siminovitchia thermophila TaxID=1245522 RepID=A0ABS2RA26_9BACI|nr:PadR family transcriptional regulator [Siminovitchia thermophila]MBM7715471.1 PadR family transcriptional regulator PadR [Siminovitchia thermophila]ONK21434.1 PadR family transcriptional regulator [Bacillus sp. VT-16-64]
MGNNIPIKGDLIRGHIDTMILNILWEGDSYGYEMIKTIFEKSGGKFELKEPSLYTSLKRLEKQKMIDAYWGNKSQGGRRKYYHMTNLGKQAYVQAVNEWSEAKEVIDLLITRRGEVRE